ncbi:MAG: alpha/beta hydrolase [Deltaproteobacteria bacterium]|nr:alpha/beta hydrolase [Deltaproteobacteria bacterium]
MKLRGALLSILVFLTSQHAFSQKVFFGTNRNPATLERQESLQLGTWEFQLGSINKMLAQEIRKPKFDRENNKWDDGKQLPSPLFMRENSFFSELNLALENTQKKSLFVFVHGFDNTFETAVETAGIISKNIDPDLIPVVFSWPSHGKAGFYTQDETMVEVSRMSFELFLKTMFTQTKATKIHLISHSMGNRLVLEVLERFARVNAYVEKPITFGQWIMIAPDVNMDTFSMVMLLNPALRTRLQIKRI